MRNDDPVTIQNTDVQLVSVFCYVLPRSITVVQVQSVLALLTFYKLPATCLNEFVIFSIVSVIHWKRVYRSWGSRGFEELIYMFLFGEICLYLCLVQGIDLLPFVSHITQLYFFFIALVNKFLLGLTNS